MKKWSIIVAGLYGLIFVVLFVTLAWIAFQPAPFEVSVLMAWQVWAVTGVMILSQFALLQLPVEVASRRPVTRRSLWTTVIAAGLMMGLLVFGAIASILEFLLKSNESPGDMLVLAIGPVSWLFWALYFHRSAKGAPPEQSVKKMQRFLWTGSILELLIAIPTHIVARNRDYCCAGILTFVGLTCGFSVMLFAFGPAIYFLFAERWQRLHPAPKA